MRDHSKHSDDTPEFELEEAYGIIEQAHLLLARMIPGCTLRRYEPPILQGGPQLLLCFADAGPIVPILTISPLKYHTLAQARFWYGLTLWQDGVRQGLTFPYVLGNFDGPVVNVLAKLNSGPEAIAETIFKALASLDFQAIIDAGTPDRILAHRPQHTHVWSRVLFALCAIYQRQYEVAEELLQAYFAESDDDQRGWIWAKMFSLATAYLAGLKSDPEGVRSDVISVMKDNWAHLKIVEPPDENSGTQI